MVSSVAVPVSWVMAAPTVITKGSLAGAKTPGAVRAVVSGRYYHRHLVEPQNFGGRIQRVNHVGLSLGAVHRKVDNFDVVFAAVVVDPL